MSWETRLLEVFDDLEQQADGLALREREAQLRDLVAGEYGQVTLEARCRASSGREVALLLRGGARVVGRLVRAGGDWVVVREQASGPATWVVPLAAVTSVTGLAEAAADASTWQVADRVPLRALLRRISQEQLEECRLHLDDGQVLTGVIARVGADFVELRGGRVLPSAALAGVRWRT